MGKIDNAINDYVAKPERFAQIVNYGIFHGKNVMDPEKLKEMERASRKKNTADKTRDIVKLYDDKTCFIIVGVENQNKIHYLMPLRVMDYDVRSYEEQRKEIARSHYEKNNLKTPEELLSRFTKEDRLKPVVTLVVYYGAQPWDGAKELHDLLDISAEMEPYRDLIENYKIHVMEINKMDNFDEFSDDLKRIFGFVKYQSNQDKLKRYVSEHEGLFEEIPEEDSDVIQAMADSKQLVKQIKKNREGEVTYMCKAIKDWEQTSIRIGEKRGEENLLMNMVRKKILKGKLIEEIADELEMSENDIRKVYQLAMEQVKKSA